MIFKIIKIKMRLIIIISKIEFKKKKEKFSNLEFIKYYTNCNIYNNIIISIFL